MIAVIEMYERWLAAENIPKIRSPEDKCFGELTAQENLAHAHWICDGAKVYARDPERQRKAGSHLTVIQMCLSNACWITRGEMMNHNRSEVPLPTGPRPNRENSAQ